MRVYLYLQSPLQIENAEPLSDLFAAELSIAGWWYIEGVRQGSNTQAYSTAVKFKISHVSFRHLLSTKNSKKNCSRSLWTKELWGSAAVS